MAKEQKEGYTLGSKGVIGTVKIADDVVAMIAGLAATEVKGVTSMAGNITNELIGKVGRKTLSKGVKIEVDGQDVSVKAAINIAYGYNIPEISVAVQEKIKSAIETMTGLNVLSVDVRIADVNFDNDK